MEVRQFTGKTVDEATGIALKTLGVELEDVDITVVSPGRSGILGLGGAPAVIQVRIRREGQPERRMPAPSPVAEPAETPAARPTSRPADRSVDRHADRLDASQGAPEPGAPAGEPGEPRERKTERRPRSTPRRTRTRTQAQAAETAAVAGDPGSDGSPTAPDSPGVPAASAAIPAMAEGTGDLAVARTAPVTEEEVDAEQDYPEAPPTERDAESEEMVAKLLDYFLASMGVVAETYVREELDHGSLVFDIEGEDAGLLIGRRGETLQALQFLVRMIVNRQLGRKAYVIIDVEGYRQRRADMLRRLARRAAGRVANTGRAMSLDPMSPAERRVIHMELADHARVRTESEGEGNRRRVVVLPRRGGGRGRGDRGDRGDRGERDERGRGQRSRYDETSGEPRGRPGEAPADAPDGGPIVEPAGLPDGDQPRSEEGGDTGQARTGRRRGFRRNRRSWGRERGAMNGEGAQGEPASTGDGADEGGASASGSGGPLEERVDSDREGRREQGDEAERGASPEGGEGPARGGSTEEPNSLDEAPRRPRGARGNRREARGGGDENASQQEPQV